MKAFEQTKRKFFEVYAPDIHSTLVTYLPMMALASTGGQLLGAGRNLMTAGRLGMARGAVAGGVTRYALGAALRLALPAAIVGYLFYRFNDKFKEGTDNVVKTLKDYLSPVKEDAEANNRQRTQKTMSLSRDLVTVAQVATALTAQAGVTGDISAIVPLLQQLLDDQQKATAAVTGPGPIKSSVTGK